MKSYQAMSSELPLAGRKPWWKGARGEWFVVAQFVAIGLVWLGPRGPVVEPAWLPAFPQAGAVAGIVLMVVGAAMLLAGFLGLGSGLTALPYPKDGADLVQAGVFGLVRHPIYSGLVMAGFGWALFVQAWLTLAYVAVLFVVLDMKARREERWLVEKFPAYAAYERRVRKLIPFVY
jgi:protein-S-isoprenylcysteine O-methyltransferase Ste14